RWQVRDRNAKESWALLDELTIYDNESWNDPKDFTKPVKAISFPQDVPTTSDSHLIEFEKQVQCLMEAHLAPMKPTQVNKMTTLCKICNGPHDTQYCMEDPEQASVEYVSSRGLTAQMNFTSTDYHSKEELQSKGIKIPSKLLSLKYLSQSAVIEQNKNLSSPKCVHFINYIVILNKVNKAGEEGSVEPSKTEYTNRENETDEEAESEKEDEEETKEEEDDDLKHFDTFPTMKEGFAAALAVLITEASQTRQHGKSEPMVNTRTDADLSAAVQNALQTLLPQICAEIREEFRTSFGPSDAGGNPPPMRRIGSDVMGCEDEFKTRLAVYKFEGNALAWWKAYKQAKGDDAWLVTVTWADFKKLFLLQFFPRAEQERLKREYHSIRQTSTETSTEFMQRFLRLAGFLGAAAGTEEEQAKNFQWGLRRSTLNHLMCMSYTDVAQVANAARNYEILHERDDDDTERPDKRRGGSDNHRSSNNNYSGSNNRSSGNGRDQRNRGHQSNRSANSGNSS
nr:hypothetical protein [Tanacetum cinerariifolium]